MSILVNNDTKIVAQDLTILAADDLDRGAQKFAAGGG